jgi:hypothetical protein
MGELSKDGLKIILGKISTIKLQQPPVLGVILVHFSLFGAYKLLLPSPMPGAYPPK